ncbi:MAG: NAD(P)-dependent oxidoreductase, partial [Brevundimonas sp.]
MSRRAPPSRAAASDRPCPLGFVGIGLMGAPMARNLLRAGYRLRVWNRTVAKAEALVAEGAESAASAREVLTNSRITIMMLLNEEATDAALQRSGDGISIDLADRLVINMGTFRPDYVAGLARDVTRAGGLYLDAPVSGSKGPAEAAQLVGMIAGDARGLDIAEPILSAMCAKVFRCGDAPNATRMKLAVNHYLVAMVASLSEAAHLAASAGLDLELFSEVLNAGPMRSAVSEAKIRKLVDRDFAAQASITDVVKNAELVSGFARSSGVASPLLDQAEQLFRETLEAGHGADDMVAVVRAL